MAGFFLSIAIVAAVLALSSSVLAVLTWKGRWSIVGRVHYSLVVLTLLAFIWWLNNWNLLGFRF